jgi:uncharacterized protein YndB with AHSA1/START domain
MNRIEVKVARIIPASPEDIFDVWLDAKSPGSPWFGSSRAIVDPKVDGLFYHSIDHDGRTWAHYGRFVRLDRGRALEHTWVSEATQGIESVVALTFESKGADTLLTVHHSNLPDDKMGRQHEEGWTFVTDILVKKFEKRRQT